MYPPHDPTETSSPVTSTYLFEPQTSPSPVSPPPPPRRARTLFLGILLGGLIAGGTIVGLWAAGAFDDPAPAAAPVVAAATTTAPPPPVTVVSPPQIVEPDPLPDASLMQAYDASDVGVAVVPSVVTVQVGSQTGDGLLARASGSGVIVDADGYIVTNDHVIATGSAYEVVLSDGRVYAADLVGTDPSTDLAVLRIDATSLEAIAIGSTGSLLVGDPAIAIGSPLGLEGGPSLTVGVLSAFGREVRTGPTVTLYGMVQTDAPITQGSSGGALVDRDGKLIGITTAVGVSDVGVEGIGFATPIEIVSRVIDELISDGEASQPFLGINGTTAFDDQADGGRRPVGVDVAAVDPGSAADDAGLLAGDVISALDDRTIDTMDELIALLRQYSSGDRIALSIARDGATIDVEVTLGQRP
jgi:putative serine protease PepD